MISPSINNNQDKVHVVSVCDDNYAQHLGVMITSLFENASKSKHIVVHIVDVGIKGVNKERLNRIALKYNTGFKFYKDKINDFSKFEVRRHITHAAYHKISIPDLLDYAISKVIYLDPDIIVKDDIWVLWNVDISDTYLAAVENPKFNRYDHLNLPRGAKIFNSGVMVINLDKWRNNRIKEKVTDILHEKSAEFFLHDQDGFNAVLYDHWIELPPKWNQQYIFHIYPRDIYFIKKDYIAAIKKPSIIHFTSHSKPWHYVNEHPQKYEYYNYLKLTEWKDYKPYDRNTINIIKKNIRPLPRLFTKKYLLAKMPDRLYNKMLMTYKKLKKVN